VKTEPLTEFTLFPRLPLELRTKVFQDALPTGPDGLRVIKVSADQVVKNTEESSLIRRRVEPAYRLTKGTKPTSSYLTYTLLDHEHSALVKDVGLSGACSE
jgi:2EXR family